MAQFFAFIELYVAPFIFAVGLVHFVYGVINYYIIGPGFEEERKEIGRRSLLWAALLSLFGLVLFSLASWLVDVVANTEFSGFNGQADIEVERGVDTLKIPNVPSVQSN